MQSRGLITTSDGTIVASPFRKFFNIEEHTSLPLEPFKVTEKMDGSLLIVTTYQGKLITATRGSFTSEQAEMARTIIQKRYNEFDFLPYYTYLFEVIYKGNRIVVDYGDMEDIVLLTVIRTSTGQEHDIHHPSWVASWPFPVVKHYDGITDITRLKELEEANKEGFVLRFESGLRVKAKFAEYVRLHKLLTQMNARLLWERLRDNQPLDDLLERVPDEFFAWIKTTCSTLQSQYAAIEQASLEVVAQVQGLPSRKEQATIVCRSQYSGVVFKMLDRKPYADVIWKMLRPSAERPFREDNEG